MSTLVISFHNNDKQTEKICLTNLEPKSSVYSLKQKIASQVKTTPDKLNFIHLGNILKDGDMLEDIGISSGGIIHCLPKTDIASTSASALSIAEVQQLLVSMRSAVSSPNFRSFIHKLKSLGMMDKVMTQCPCARRDPSALILLQDPELFQSLLKPDELTRVVEARPVVGRLAQVICSMIASEVTTPRRSHHISYSMDALSDEEMDTEQSGDSDIASRASGSSFFQPITPAQLAAALANATGGSSTSRSSGGASSAPRSFPHSPSAGATPFNTPAPGSSAPSSATITSEMFSQALQNALAASASRGSVPSRRSLTPSSGRAVQNMEESLQQMREMGIGDEDMSREALLATNGDVQAAINLIFAQYMADD